MLDEIQRLALAFAEAITDPGRQAGLIDAENRRTGWASIAEAVASDSAFMVRPREGILPLDLDSGDAWAWASRVRDRLAQRGCDFVVTHSGGAGRGHMWVIAPPGWTSIYTKEQAYEAEPYDDRTVARCGTLTRPPYSPHRSGDGRSVVVDPGPSSALALFRSTHPRPLPEATRILLRGLDPADLTETKHGKPSRGLSLGRVAVSAVNHRWSFEDFLRELDDPTNRTASKYRDYSGRARLDYATRLWNDATSWVRDNPPAPSVAIARTAVKELAKASASLSWSTRTGANDRAVYKSLLALAFDGGVTEPKASVRLISDRSRVSKNGVMAALVRLQERGLIQRLPPLEPYGSTVYRLLPIRADDGKPFIPRDNIGLPTGDQRLLLSCRPALLADVFSNGTGLGLSCRETWDALPEEPTKVADLLELLPGQLSRPTVRGHLRRLESHGFAARKGHRWWRTHPDDESLLRTCSMLGSAGKTAARREYHSREAAEYRKRFNLPDPALSRQTADVANAG